MSAYGDYNAAWCDPEALIDFVTVTSAFYPELRASYDEEAGEWLAKRRRSKQDERTDRFLASASSYQHCFLVPMSLDNALRRAASTERCSRIGEPGRCRRRSPASGHPNDPSLSVEVAQSANSTERFALTP